jgi:cytochrome c553
MDRKRSVLLPLNPWILGSVCLVVVFWAVSIVVGFVWYPAVGGGLIVSGSTDLSSGPARLSSPKSSAKEGASPYGLLQLICGGLGLVNTQVYSAQPQPQPVVSSDLAWTDATWQKIRTGDQSRGVAISSSCVACHGQESRGTADYIPNLDGLPREVIYKELIDYRTGKRNYVTMNAVALGLSEQDIADVAAYYSSCLPESTTTISQDWRRNERKALSDEFIDRLITDGDPMRNVVACAACHGPEGLKTGAPPLAGQPAQYLANQLTAFSQGTRNNDINSQMRLILTRLTPEEINGLAEYLGAKNAQKLVQKSKH